MKETQTFRAAVIDRCADLHKIIRSSLNVDVALPKVMFRLRGTTAGRANMALNIIDLNLPLMRDNYEAFIRDTVPHEYAHIMVPQLWQRLPLFPHGKEWQGLMRVFGVKPKIMHGYDVSKIAPTYAYTCQCTAHQVSKVLHSRLLKGEAYHCPVCKQDVKRYS